MLTNKPLRPRTCLFTVVPTIICKVCRTSALISMIWTPLLDENWVAIKRTHSLSICRVLELAQKKQSASKMQFLVDGLYTEIQRRVFITPTTNSNYILWHSHSLGAWTCSIACMVQAMSSPEFSRACVTLFQLLFERNDRSMCNFRFKYSQFMQSNFVPPNCLCCSYQISISFDSESEATKKDVVVNSQKKKRGLVRTLALSNLQPWVPLLMLHSWRIERLFFWTHTIPTK